MVRCKVFTDIKIQTVVSKMVANVHEEAAVHPKHWCPSTNYMATEDSILIHSKLTSQPTSTLSFYTTTPIPALVFSQFSRMSGVCYDHW
jgi:hypothetical protein